MARGRGSNWQLPRPTIAWDVVITGTRRSLTDPNLRFGSGAVSASGPEPRTNYV